jgi:hypothetical protein
VRIPHFMLNEDGLQDQLREQTEAALEAAAEAAQRKRPGGDNARGNKAQSTKEEAAEILGQARKAAAATGGKSAAAPGGGDGDAAAPQQDSEERADLPADCVEISAEEAIQLQERALKKRAGAAGQGAEVEIGGEATTPVSGLKNRKASASALAPK